MITPFIQHKTFDSATLSTYLRSAESTNHWSNYGVAVKELESRAREMLKISDEKAVIATSSGTGALHALVYGIREFDQADHRVTTQDFTFPSASLGPCAGPIVVDFDQELNMQMEDTYLIDYGKICITTNCFGHLQNLDYIVSQAEKLGKILIFDNSATPYSFYKQTNSCNLGVGSCIALHHTKPIGFGEGGLAIIDKKYEETTRSAINFGYDDNKNFSERSGNFKMSELAAAGILQWWDSFDIDELMEIYLDNYYTAKYKLTTDSDGQCFPNNSDDEFLPFCLPWIHDKPIKVEDAFYKHIECKKYYRPLRSDATINSHIVYERIMCYPIHGGVSDL